MPWPKVCPDILASGACPYGSRCAYNHTVLSCEPCGFIGRSQYEFRQHVDSRQHRSRSTQTGRGRALTSYCPQCQENIPEHAWDKHLSWPRHRQKEAAAKHRSILDEAERNKSCVTIEGVTDLGFIDPMDVTDRWEGQTQTLAAKSGGAGGTVTLRRVELASRASSRPFDSGLA